MTFNKTWVLTISGFVSQTVKRTVKIQIFYLKMSQELSSTPPDLTEIAHSAVETLIPAKSKKIYDFAYEKFLKWSQEHNVHNYSENVLLAYFSQLSQKIKSSSLWAQYSMIKAELNLKHNVQIDKYTKLIAFLKRQSEGYKPKKSRVFTKEQFDAFLHNAPNNMYLATKVISQTVYIIQTFYL